MAAITPFLDRAKKTDPEEPAEPALPLGDLAIDAGAAVGALGDDEAQEQEFEVDEDIVITDGPGAPSLRDLAAAPEPLGDLGGVTELPALAASHANLTRMVWVRRSFEEAMLTGGPDGGPREFWVESGKTGGELVYKINPPIPGDVIPWFKGVEIRSAALFGENGKMRCPTWDLPAGAPSIGGSCPGATSGQTIVEPRIRAGQLARQADGTLTLPMPVPGESHLRVLNEAGAICEMCVTGDTRVLVKGRGLVRIEDLVGAGGFEVWSGIGWRVTHAVRKGAKPVVEVRTSWGQSIRCTTDHPIATREDGFVEAGSLEDEQLAYQPPTVDGAFSTSDVVIARRPVDWAGKRYKTAVEEHFPASWNFNVGLFLGYILGDGCISKGDYPTIRIGLGEEDANDLHRLQSIVAKWCSTETEVSIKEVEARGLVQKANQRRATIAWRVKGLVEFVEDCGLDKSPAPSDRRAPAGIWTASADAVRGFLSGLFSTDGSVLVQSSKVEITLASVSKGLLQDVQQLLFAFGVKSTICAYSTSNVWRTEQGYNSLYKLSISAYAEVKLFHASIGFWNERKSAKLEQAIHDCSHLMRLRRTWPHVTAVEPLLHEEEVYDLVNVGEEHQFVANGLTVHNCYATEGRYPTSRVQVGEIIRYWWSKMLMETDEGVEQWVTTMVRAIAALDIPRTRDGIRPIRIHSSGDFFSFTYAAAWIEVANRVWDLEIEMGRTHPEIRFWAPTRTWAARGWVGKWDQLAEQLHQPNLIVRPSSYHVDDEAPGALTDGWPVGATSVINDHNRGMRPDMVKHLHDRFAQIEAERHRGEPDDTRFDWTCQTYAVDKKGTDLTRSCHDAPGPDGKMGCRACWNRPDLRINYTTH
jgi:intein/homing endonuclease